MKANHSTRSSPEARWLRWITLLSQRTCVRYLAHQAYLIPEGKEAGEARREAKAKPGPAKAKSQGQESQRSLLEIDG